LNPSERDPKPAAGISVDTSLPFYMFWHSLGIDGKSSHRDSASISGEADGVAL